MSKRAVDQIVETISCIHEADHVERARQVATQIRTMLTQLSIKMAHEEIMGTGFQPERSPGETEVQVQDEHRPG